MSDRQKAIEEAIINQKNLTNDLVRSMALYTTADQLKAYLKDNQVDLSAVQKDIALLHSKLDSVNTFVTNSLGYDWHDLPSDNKKPSIKPVVPQTIECNGEKIDCIKDVNGYLSTQQIFKLNEKFKSLDIPIGTVTFDGSKSQPWNVSMSGRQYKSLVINAVDENGRSTYYNQFRIVAEGKEYKVPIDQAVTQQIFPEPVWRWWSPRLFLGLGAGLDFNTLKPEYGPSLSLAIMNYGRYVQTPDISVLQLGVSAGLNSRELFFELTPLAYNVGKHFPFILNTYVAPSVQISPSGDVAAMLGIRLGL